MLYINYNLKNRYIYTYIYILCTHYRRHTYNIYLSICLSVCLSVCRSIHPSIHLPISLSSYYILDIYIYIYLHIYIWFIYLNVSPDTPASQTLGYLWQLGPHQAQLQVLQLEGTAQLLDRSKPWDILYMVKNSCFIPGLYQVYIPCIHV